MQSIEPMLLLRSEKLPEGVELARELGPGESSRSFINLIYGRMPDHTFPIRTIHFKMTSGLSR
jgi:hypothetical protein